MLNILFIFVKKKRMKKIIFTLLLSIFSFVSWGRPIGDSIYLFPKPAKNYINVVNPNNDSAKYDIFLFRKDGHLLKSSLKDLQLNVTDIPRGDYVLEIFDNDSKYRFYIQVEN